MLCLRVDDLMLLCFSAGDATLNGKAAAKDCGRRLLVAIISPYACEFVVSGWHGIELVREE